MDNKYKITIKTSNGDTTSNEFSIPIGSGIAIDKWITEYLEGTDGTNIPTGEWSTNIPTITNGNFLWTRLTTIYSDGTKTIAYTVSAYTLSAPLYSIVLHTTDVTKTSVSATPIGKFNFSVNKLISDSTGEVVIPLSVKDVTPYIELYDTNGNIILALGGLDYNVSTNTWTWNSTDSDVGGKTTSFSIIIKIGTKIVATAIIPINIIGQAGISANNLVIGNDNIPISTDNNNKPFNLALGQFSIQYIVNGVPQTISTSDVNIVLPENITLSKPSVGTTELTYSISANSDFTITELESISIIYKSTNERLTITLNPAQNKITYNIFTTPGSIIVDSTVESLGTDYLNTIVDLKATLYYPSYNKQSDDINLKLYSSLSVLYSIDGGTVKTATADSNVTNRYYLNLVGAKKTIDVYLVSDYNGTTYTLEDKENIPILRNGAITTNQVLGYAVLRYCGDWISGKVYSDGTITTDSSITTRYLDYVTYNSLYYICSKYHTSAATFEADKSNWQLVTNTFDTVAINDAIIKNLSAQSISANLIVVLNKATGTASPVVLAGMTGSTTISTGKVVDSNQTVTFDTISTYVDSSNSEQIRIFAGVPTDNKLTTCPFYVTDLGYMKATKGMIGGLAINGVALTNEGFNNDAEIILRKDIYSLGNVWLGTFAGIGTNVLPASSASSAVARFENYIVTAVYNAALVVGAKNGASNHAIDILCGDIANFSTYTKQVSTDTTLSDDVSYVTTYETSDITIKLPADPNIGKDITIFNINSNTITVNGNGKKIITGKFENGSNQHDTVNINHAGEEDRFHYDGQFWTYSYGNYGG